MCNKSIICGVLFAPGAIPFYEGNNMLSALAKYVINRLIHGLFHIALVISSRLILPLYLNKSFLSFHRRYFRNQPIRNKNCL